MPNSHFIAVVTLLYLSTGLIDPIPSYANFYKYRDSRGTVCITNDFNKVPLHYRSRVKIIKDDAFAPASPPAVAPRDAPAAGEQDAPADTQPAGSEDGWLARQAPFLKLMAVIVGLFCLALLVSRVVSALLPNMLGKVIRIAFFLGIGVFLFKSYSERMVSAFLRLRSETNTVQKAVDKRYERIRKQVDP